MAAWCRRRSLPRTPIRLVESGPAAGALAGAWFAGAAGEDRLLCFDMGGTTAKSCLIEDHEPSMTMEFEVARIYRFKKGSGLPVTVPSVDLVEIGAGGGSLAHVDDLGLLKVGPESAGADPGPAAYGQGGVGAAVTDADLLLGFLDADYFLGGDMPLDRDAATEALAKVAAGVGVSVVDAAGGVHDVVNQNMAAAARMHAVERGVDLRGVTVLAFGGAGPVHACGVAELLDSPRVVFPARASVLSAFGTLVTPVRIDLARTMVRPLLDVDEAERDALLAELCAEGARGAARSRSREGRRPLPVRGRRALPRPGARDHRLGRRRRDLAGLGLGDDDGVLARLRARVRDVDPRRSHRGGHVAGRRLGADATARDPAAREWRGRNGGAREPPAGVVHARRTSRRHAGLRAGVVAFRGRHRRSCGRAGAGDHDRPATALARRGDRRRIDRRHQGDGLMDAIELEVLWASLVNTVNEQAKALQRSAFSPIVREAGDLANALFDREGRMVAQAVTGTPGHINSLAVAARNILDEYPRDRIEPGDVLVTNDPYKTAGQLLDVTVLSPVWHHDDVIGYFGSTIHHTDVGGYGIGAGARDVFEEGLWIPITKLMVRGERNPDVWRFILANVREPEHMAGDLHAQVASGEIGAARLRALCDAHGLDDIEHLSEEVRSRSEDATRKAIRALPEGRYEARSVLDLADGSEIVIQVAVIVDSTLGSIVVDYTGSSGASPYGINVVKNYTHAYSTFTIRSVLNPDVPNNAGSLRPIDVIAPEGSIVNAVSPAPCTRATSSACSSRCRC